MSARVLQFTGEWQGRTKPQSQKHLLQRAALFEARQIMEAKQAADNWMSVMLLGLLQSMHSPDRLRLGLAIGTHAGDNSGARQALALIRLAGSDKGDKEHRARVMAALSVLQEGEAR